MIIITTPQIWNTLHNFGGNQGLLGTLYNIAVGVPEAKKYPNSTVIGVGITMEGIWQNYIVYDETMKMAFVNDDMLDLDKYVNKYALRRYGLPHSVSSRKEDAELCVNNLQSAWTSLKDSVYNISHWGGVTKNLMCIVPSLNAIHNGFMPTQLNYDPTIIQKVWQKFIQLIKTDIINIEKFRYDLIDISRQAISDQFNLYYQQMNSSYYEKELVKFKQISDTLIELFDDLDNLLNTNKYWMLGEWIEMARSHTTDRDESNWWEFNARNQVTLWGPDGEISNYASKTWGGLISGYHKPQWQLFLNQLESSLRNNKPFNQTAYNEENMQTIAQPWQHETNKYPTIPINDTIIVACDLYNKYNTLSDQITCS